MPTAANDNVRHIADPFHRHWKGKLLHRDSRRNDALYYVGDRYARDWDNAGCPTSLEISTGYDAVRQISFADKMAGPYYAAAAVLEKLELRSIVEQIIFQGRLAAQVGRAATGRAQAEQARAAALMGLSVALRVLELHYAGQNDAWAKAS